MRLADFFKRQNRDLFGQPMPASEITRPLSSELAFDLRRLSEKAVQGGMARSGCLIELAALIVEMEGAYESEDQLR